MYNILISGYYGFNNIGDESILRAVVESLREKLPEVDITVLSQNPESTAMRHNVKSVDRKSVSAIIKAIKRCDLLISGGGSLLQDVTSKKSILYYLGIMQLAKMMGKKVFIYSQGMGPIQSNINRRLTARTLKKADGIVVRDQNSKEVLEEIGLSSKEIYVATDPVLRIKKADLAIGREILKREGVVPDESRITVGWAVRERKMDSQFIHELCMAIKRLDEEYNAQSVLIPFHYSEDMGVIHEIQSRLQGQVKVGCVRHKYLTDEMLSIIGNMDVLVGVRLHSVIHAAIMDVPVIAISYDPKVNSFMNSIDMKAMCSVYDFRCGFFMEEFQRTLDRKDETLAVVRKCINELILKLDINEKLIAELMEKK